MELLDIVDEQGCPTGKTEERSIVHANGLRHRTSHVWIARSVSGRWQVLLQKRALNKDSFPGKYDTSSAGHIPAGVEPLDSAIRELEEELGIKAAPEQLEFIGSISIFFEKEFHGKMFKDNEKVSVFLFNGDVDIDHIAVQKEEIDSVAWFDLEETFEACMAHDPRFCVPVKGLALVRDYLERKSPMAE